MCTIQYVLGNRDGSRAFAPKARFLGIRRGGAIHTFRKQHSDFANPAPAPVAAFGWQNDWLALQACQLNSVPCQLAENAKQAVAELTYKRTV
jgi:hypothetical protein